MDTLVAKRYVKALVEALGSKGIESALKSLQAVAKAFEDPKFAAAMAAPEIKAEQREALVLALLGKKADKKLVNFVKTLGVHNRFNLIPEIAQMLAKEIQRRAGKYEGVVESSVKLDDKEIKALEQSLSRYVDATIVLKQRDTGRDGIRVVVEDLGIEASFSKERIAHDMINHILKAL
jgi:F-type H+-transporting ATPase subunit delta